MRALVIDFDISFANTLGRALEKGGCQVQVASSAPLALRLLGQGHFDSILIDSYAPAVASREILRQIYTHVPSKVYVMTNVPPLRMAPDTRRDERMDVVPATAESVLSVVRDTRDSDIALVAGSNASKNLALTLSEEGYPTAVTHDIRSAICLFFEGKYPVVFLQAAVPALTGPDEFAVLHTLTARSLAVLAHARPSRNLCCGVKPRRIAEVTQILRKLQEDSGKPERAMSFAVEGVSQGEING